MVFMQIIGTKFRTFEQCVILSYTFSRVMIYTIQAKAFHNIWVYSGSLMSGGKTRASAATRSMADEGVGRTRARTETRDCRFPYLTNFTSSKIFNEGTCF